MKQMFTSVVISWLPFIKNAYLKVKALSIEICNINFKSTKIIKLTAKPFLNCYKYMVL